MSQFFVKSTSGGGGGGDVNTLTGDDAIVVGPDGSGNINVIGGTSTVNNTKGITVLGDAGTFTETFTLTNRVSVSTVTSDGAGQTQNVTLFTPTNATSISWRALISGYDSLDLTAGGEMIGISRKSGGLVVVVGSNDIFEDSDAALATADYDILASGADLIIRFVGVAGRTISWRALFEYTQAP